jgi:hypothetical protein
MYHSRRAVASWDMDRSDACARSELAVPCRRLHGWCRTGRPSPGLRCGRWASAARGPSRRRFATQPPSLGWSTWRRPMQARLGVVVTDRLLVMLSFVVPKWP